MKLILCLLLTAFAVTLPAQTVGQYEVRKRGASGFTSYGVTLADGQVIGQTAGVPAAITPVISSDLSAYLTSASAASTYQPIVTWSTGLTNTSGTVTVNGIQPLSRATNLTTNGFVKTSGADGTLVVDATSYQDTSGTLGLAGFASITGILPKANGGTGTSTPGLVAGTGISITGTWPNQTITNDSTALVIGSTVISLGVSGRLLWDNAGKVDEMALGTGVRTAMGNAINAAGGFITTGGVGSVVQAYDADLTTWAGITPGTGVATALGNAVNAASGLMTYDSDLATWAGITPTANIQSLLASADHTLLYDAANSRIMINTATSQAAALTVSTTVGGDDALILRDSTNGGNARFYFTTPLGSPPDLHIQADRLYLNAITYAASIFSTDGTLEVCNGEIFKVDHCYQFIVQTNGANTVIFNGGANIDTTIRPYPGQTLDLSPDGDPIKMSGNISVTKTIITAGTTGNQTINKTSGRVNFAAAATSLVVTNSYVTAGSIIQCTIATNDSTMTSVSVVAGSGSFTIYANAAPTAECAVNFTVTN